ncbi:MAG: restriction system protein [Verrucomicrobiota bacterium]|jgi:hypothetical protein
MANPQIQQVVDTMWWKLAPWILFCAFIGTFAGLFVKWLERRATEFGRRRQARIKTKAQQEAPWVQADEAPHCPICNAGMVKRTAKRGARTGNSFWGCPNYPKCRGTRDI